MIYDHQIEFVNGEPVMMKSDGIPETLEPAEPLRRQCIEFLECIKSGRKPLTDGESGLQVLRVLAAAEQSLSSKGVPVETAISTNR